MLLLGWVFVPFYMRSRVFTMPEFLEKRYRPAARWILSLTALIAYVLTKISVIIDAGAVVFQTLMGIDFWTGALVVVILTGIDTVLGGLRAVVYTESLQAIVLLVGSATVTIMGLVRLGGWSRLVELAGPDRLNMFSPASHPRVPMDGHAVRASDRRPWYSGCSRPVTSGRRGGAPSLRPI